ncbi:MAG: hypothetical protein CVU40_10110 [Chloroflexi bacterium HGW-Chloroflexi-2]|jgi:glycosyltransferase involved in cell wall biosynthesis|nr:MAG: hypothetical protein CVU40_10110 [Chloroflexi bacterium HGW-Chloroflexi-2]
MRLGFHYHIPAIMKESKIFMPGYLGRFLDSLASECESITCFMHSPVGLEIDEMDYALKAQNIHLVDIGPHVSVPKRMLSSFKVKKIVRKFSEKIDLMLIRGPSPLLPDIANVFKRDSASLLIVGDYLAGIVDSTQPSWRKVLVRIWSKWNSNRQLKIANSSLVFVNSHLLFQHYQFQTKNLVETRTTTLSLTDFYKREDTCQTSPLHLLYTGRIDRAKGLLDILDALKTVVGSGEDIVFDLVGMLVKGDNILEEIFNKAKLYGLSERIKFHGYKPLGPELFEFYKQADIYILASQSSEGFPRTIWEAMAHSLPVIATKVGSIPDFVGGAALLVDPNRPDKLAAAVKEIISNKELRVENINKGYELAQTNTLEIRAKQMITEMENYLRRLKK